MTVRQIRIQYLLAPAKLFIHNDFFFLLLFLLGFSFSFQSVFLVSILFLLFENVCSLY